ncbi:MULTISPECIES: hypothetical protein [unclassified Neochlamydia]|nr:MULTISPECIES: hypothetical protein [unclassified Neochlamydia]
MIEFAELITEALLKRDVQHADPFEAYAHRLRSHFYNCPERFKRRFAEGYCLLVKELEKESIH